MMSGQKELLVIIPAYNEEKNIQEVLKQIRSQRIEELADVLVIDDASEDSTAQIVKASRHLLIRNIDRLGYGNALRVGYQYAVKGNYRYVIQMDADGQHDVCNIPVIYKRLLETDVDGHAPDIVLASRFMKGSSAFPVSLLKKIAYAWFRLLVYAAAGRKIADPTTGLQGLSRKAFCYYSDFRHFDDKYPDANIIALMILIKFRVVEVPAVMHARTEGKSMHSGLKPIWYMLRVTYSMLIIFFQVKVLKMDAEVGLKSADKI